jgi:hypothetical protein
MRSRFRIVVGLLSIAAFVTTGCTQSQPDRGGCVDDYDCKGERICSNSGKCISPSTTPDGGTLDAVAADDTADIPDTPDANPADVPLDSSSPDVDALDSTDADVIDVKPDSSDDADTQSDVDAGCTQAHLRAKTTSQSWQTSSLTVEPLDTVQVDASLSSGNVDQYEWTILSRPHGSYASLSPDNTSPDPTLFLDVAGSYEVQLRTFDENGTPNCNSDPTLIIDAVPTDDLYIELVWDTPGDPDQMNSNGTDLDLHYLHENGRWDVAPWDVFWRNPTADWGVQDDSSDDPELINDTTSGLGPEQIIHNGLESVTYRVGAYYYNENGFGPSYATVNIYVNGQHELEKRDKHLPATGTLWEVARIEQQGALVTDVDTTHQGFP